jgi:prepilin-type N-terminal cleavage/methylation domain-containing protein/prepilin-type processing-associated H-X9-DG protein
MGQIKSKRRGPGVVDGVLRRTRCNGVAAARDTQFVVVKLRRVRVRTIAKAPRRPSSRQDVPPNARHKLRASPVSARDKTLCRRRAVTSRRAFTVIELLVSLTVAAVLLALLLPAVQSARQAARKAQCASNLKQLGVAIGAYEAVHRMFPPGGAYGASLHVALLPHLDQKELFERYDFVRRDDAAVRGTQVAVFLCPADSASPIVDGVASTNYAGNCGTGVQAHGYNGMFRHLATNEARWPEGPVRAADMRDGLSNTAALCEMLRATGQFERLRVNWQTPTPMTGPDQLGDFAAICRQIPPSPPDYGWRGGAFDRGRPWTTGDVGYTLYNHVLLPNEPSCTNGGNVQTGISTPSSGHAGGVNVLFGDGHVDHIGFDVDRNVWTEFGSRIDSDVRHGE